jgi:hypothetical protein
MCQIYVKKDLENNCSNATNASVNANIQQPKSIKQFPCKYPCGNCKNAVTWKTPGVDRFGYSYLNNLYDTTYHIGHSRYLQFAMLLLYYIDHKDVWVL